MDEPHASRVPRGRQRTLRADARRNVGTLLDAALAVFSETGVDAPAREIADRAGVGIGTLYRHFPRRSDLVVAVFRQEVDACADAAAALARDHAPGEALARWMLRYVDFIRAKRGLAAALYSGDPAFESLPGYFQERLHPALERLLAEAAGAGEIRSDIQAADLLRAVASLCTPATDVAPDHARRMVSLLVDGLKYGAEPG